jgi:methyl-accepting chemotaxis protein
MDVEMPFLNNLKIATKIVLLLLMLATLAVGIAHSGARRIRTSNAAYAQLVTVDMPDITRLARVNRRATEMVYAGYRSMAYDGQSRTAREAGENERVAHDEAIKLLDTIAAAEPEHAAFLRDVRASVEAIHARSLAAVRLGLRNQDESARAQLESADVLVRDFGNRVAAYNQRRTGAAADLANTLNAEGDLLARHLMTFGLLGSLLAMAIGAYAARRAITMPLARLRDAMETLAGGDARLDVPGAARGDEIGEMAKAVMVFRDAVAAQQRAASDKAAADAVQQHVVATVGDSLSRLAAGDFTTTITADFPDGYAALKTNLNAATGALRDLIGGVVASSSAIGTGSTEIAQASEDLARRTESNAASLEETSAAIGEMDIRLRTTAEAAATTVQRADGAIASVSTGRAVADDAVGAMSRVADSAKGIDNVIEGLDKIAFQTRVLAMNAAVEAGRAGDAGRGFAVVADLVSALAMRAEEEAQRARDQLSVTQTEIVTAVEAVRRVDGALADISGNVAEVHQLLGSMAADNRAQAIAISQISASIGSMDQTTQQNAAMVEETSAAARSLATEVGELSRQANRFTIGTIKPPLRDERVALPARKVAKSTYTPPRAALRLAGSTADADWSSF